MTHSEQTSPTLVINGIDGATGRYLLGPLPMDLIADVARGYRPTESELQVLQLLIDKAELAASGNYATIHGPQLEDLAHAGWAAIIAEPEGQKAGQHRADIERALAPLFDLRREQASKVDERRFRTLSYRRGESWYSFLNRHGIEPVPRQHEHLPYYLLFVGSPREIPFDTLYEANIQYAVGRIHFATMDEYAAYAANAVAAEREARAEVSAEISSESRGTRPTAAFFGVRTPGDLATELSADDLVNPLADHAEQAFAGQWQVTRHMAENASKECLARLIGGAAKPALLFTTSHGMGFAANSDNQRSHQGALLCGDWPGPGQAVAAEHYFAGHDISEQADMRGMISFHFACFGAGTPEYDDFVMDEGQSRSRRLAREPFIARLPQRMLGHARGSLAFVGHVDRAWDRSFRWHMAEQPMSPVTPYITTFKNVIGDLMKGSRVGHAMDEFRVRHAQMAASLTNLMHRARTFGIKPSSYELAEKWLSYVDSRNYAVIGDPAVRLATARPDA